MNEFPVLEPGDGNIVLFHPHIPAGAAQAVQQVLGSRWIGQGPRVAEFERRFAALVAPDQDALAVGSGTDALHLAYLLAGLVPGDEVIAPVFTCTATNIPFLYMGVKPVFADVQRRTLNMDPAQVRTLITPRTKAIVCVHYGGLPCDLDELHAIAREHGLVFIEDAAHALGAAYKGRAVGGLSDFTMFSFQAIKLMTTGDGGMLMLRDPGLLEKARRLRWFGIDRSAKQLGVWENDITEIGYKYQMTDLAAALGLAAMDEYASTLAKRQSLLDGYVRGFAGVPGIELIGAGHTDRTHAAWLCTVLVEDRVGLMRKLREHRIESGQVHYRNDRYKIFGGRQEGFTNMDALEDRYLVLPLHGKMSLGDVDRVCSVVKAGW